MATTASLDQRIAEVRRFNRFYTRQIGVLTTAHLQSPFSLGEVRVLYEIAHRGTTTAAQLAADLDLDAGYLSRMLRAFTKRRLVTRTHSAEDARQRVLSLTTTGRSAFAALDVSARNDIASMVAHLSVGQQEALVQAMHTIEQLIGKAKGPSEVAQPANDRTPVSASSPASATTSTQSAPFVLRNPDPGDLGWILHRHGTLYAREYGWDWRFEGLVASVLSEFVANFVPSRERCWVAERDGEIVGSVFVVQQSPTTAKLRLLYVEPSTRGLGLGRELVKECVRFARRVGYKRMTLWTNSVLTSARRIYEAEGFTLKKTELHSGFGPELTSETWELTL